MKHILIFCIAFLCTAYTQRDIEVPTFYSYGGSPHMLLYIDHDFIGYDVIYYADLNNIMTSAMYDVDEYSNIVYNINRWSTLSSTSRASASQRMSSRGIEVSFVPIEAMNSKVMNPLTYTQKHYLTKAGIMLTEKNMYKP